MDSLTQELEGKAGVPGRSAPPVNNNNPFQSLPAPAPSKNPFKSSNLNLGAWNQLWNSRNKRQATEGLLQPTEEDFKEFLMDFEDFKGDVASKMGNLTCVLKKMNALDDNLQINMKEYTGDFWNKIDLSQTMAGEDPEWRNMLVTSYKDCYDIARSWPQSTLNRNPLMKVFGRHMVFFKCARVSLEGEIICSKLTKIILTNRKRRPRPAVWPVPMTC